MPHGLFDKVTHIMIDDTDRPSTPALSTGKERVWSGRPANHRSRTTEGL